MPAKKKTETAKTTRQGPRRQNTLAEAVAAPAPATLVAFAIGDRVSHQQFGSGTIVAVKGSTLSIAFDEQGTRHIIESYVKRLKQQHANPA